MARQQWRIRVRGKQREQINADLLVAAVIALGEQLAAEEREREESAVESRTTPSCQPEQEERGE
jgi:hypothetical protein